MYNWLRQKYEDKIYKELQNAIDSEEITQTETNTTFIEKMQEWEIGYGDYMYDLVNDR